MSFTPGWGPLPTSLTIMFLLVVPLPSGGQTTGQVAGAPQPAGAPATTWQYGGFVDIGYLFDANDPPNKLFRSRGTTFRLNDAHLNMSGAYAKKRVSERSRWGAELLVHAGKDDEVFGFSATAPNLAGHEWMGHLGLANVSYLAPAGQGLTLQGGIFTSLIGYDSLYAKDNFNYTRPWGADFTPYLMLGLNASYPLSKAITATAFVINGYWHLANANRVPSSGLQLAFAATDRVSVKETVLWGPHQSDTSTAFWRFLSDTIIEHRTGRLVIAGQYHFSTERVDTIGRPRAWWMASQLPLRWHAAGPVSLAFRPEVAWDSRGRWTGAEQTVAAVTSTLEYRVLSRWATTILRMEHRFDRSRGPGGGFFRDGPAPAGVVRLTPRQHLLVFAAMVGFDSRR